MRREMKRRALRARQALGWVAIAAIILPAPLAAQRETKLTAAQIQAEFAGKIFRVRTAKSPAGDPANPSAMVPRGDLGFSIMELFFRSDHSVIFRCTSFDRSGRPGPCQRTGAGTRDVGVWSIEGDRFCYQWLEARGSQKQCYDVYREGAGYRVRLASGPLSTIDGEVMEPK